MATILHIFELLGAFVGVLATFVFYFALLPYVAIKLIQKVVRATIKRL